MIVYRLTPYTDAERYALYGDHWNDPVKLPEHPTKRDLVESASVESRNFGFPYADYLAFKKSQDARFRNIGPPM